MAGDSPTIDSGTESVIVQDYPVQDEIAPVIQTQERRVVLDASKRSTRLKTVLGVLLVLIDMVMLIAAFRLAYTARTSLPIFGLPVNPPSFEDYLPTMLLHVFIVIAFLYFSRLYHERRAVSRIDQARHILGVVTIGSVIVFGMQELIFKNSIFEVDYPRGLFFYVWILSAFLVGLGREFYRLLLARLRTKGVVRDNLLIVGTSRLARDIAKNIQLHPRLGYNIVGVVSEQFKPKGKMLEIPIIGLYHDLPYLIDAYQVEQVIIALPDAKRAEIVDLVTLCQRGRVDIKVYPDIFAYMAGDLNVDDLGGTPLLTVRDIALRGWRLSLKRSMDIFGSFFGLVFLSPLMLLTAVLIRLESKGPVFYVQERMGLDGRPFPMIKFRSMQANAETDGPGWTQVDDPRRTRLGKIMRRTNWDEIPQLINVLLGQMSLVGPRPERPVYVEEFRQHIPRYMQRHREKAGMTGWAQVNGLRGDTSIAERTAFDLWYVENWSVWLDLKIILRQLMQIILRRDKNAY
jgi:exopolysaccharide biosynthesis polyprenyl glycosylphosphotransferase